MSSCQFCVECCMISYISFFILGLVGIYCALPGASRQWSSIWLWLLLKSKTQKCPKIRSVTRMVLQRQEEEGHCMATQGHILQSTEENSLNYTPCNCRPKWRNCKMIFRIMFCIISQYVRIKTVALAHSRTKLWRKITRLRTMPRGRSRYILTLTSVNLHVHCTSHSFYFLPSARDPRPCHDYSRKMASHPCCWLLVLLMAPISVSAAIGTERSVY